MHWTFLPCYRRNKAVKIDVIQACYKKTLIKTQKDLSITVALNKEGFERLIRKLQTNPISVYKLINVILQHKNDSTKKIPLILSVFEHLDSYLGQYHVVAIYCEYLS